MILKVTKLPLVVEAIQITGSQENANLLFRWSDGEVYESSINKGIFMVQCLEALAETPIGSYVVKGIKGEVWPVREDIFNETYKILGE